MNWEDLRYILALAREGTLLAAAKSLRVSPSTMARRLRALEDDHGTALFEKFKHGAVLSEAGARVVAVAERVESLTDQLDAEIHGLDQKLEGSIRVTSVEFLIRHWISEFGAFTERYPGVELELTSTATAVNLTQREADVALRLAPRAPEHLIGTKLAEFMYCIYGSAELVERMGPDAGYSDYPWLSWDLAFARSTDKVMEERGPGAKVALRVSEMSVMKEAVDAGLGITIMPCFIGDASPNLRRVGDYFEGGLYLWVLTHPQLRGSARITAFTRYVRDLAKRDKDLIEGRCPAA